tara:strand:- start:14475 stop:14762 length:288 start_codon:yes stop_codon:yes gene_type:complete
MRPKVQSGANIILSIFGGCALGMLLMTLIHDHKDEAEAEKTKEQKLFKADRWRMVKINERPVQYVYILKAGNSWLVKDYDGGICFVPSSAQWKGL